MKTNIKEELLMAYLYGELNADEKTEVEKLFSASPEDKSKLEEMLFIKSALGNITDKEVITPPIFNKVESNYEGREAVPPSGLPSQRHGVRGLWVTPIRYSIGIAAAFLIVMLGAKLLGFHAQSTNEGLLIGFGDIKQKEQSVNLSPEQIQQMINTSLHKNNDFVSAAWGESQSKINDAFKQNVMLASQSINETNKNSLSSSKEEIRQFMESLRGQNTQLLQDYVRLSGNEQKLYIENLLVDFTKYMQEQRSQDLNIVNTRLNTLEADNSLFREEAGQILTSLVSNENNSSVKRN